MHASIAPLPEQVRQSHELYSIYSALADLHARAGLLRHPEFPRHFDLRQFLLQDQTHDGESLVILGPTGADSGGHFLSFCR